ncbi:MAG: PAC2 family protein [Phycisphaerales bacterium]|nr:PAC2 family protein [Phycisphaerales bacterium]MCI0630757.1 PAC2 family protein [Phycisphaerales bacterium]
MAQPDQLRDPWLIAAWPGMGNVAVGAAAYLVSKLNAPLVHELTARELFDLPHIEVNKGLAKPGRVPRNMFFEWRDPTTKRDLLIFIGEAQPSLAGYSFCHKLLDYAQQRGVTRVMTFAAMASQLHPAGQPRVFAVATAASLLAQVKQHNAHVLEEGQISGLNGVLLAAGAERDLPGLCLLGELPFFAAAVPNPKASLAVLDVFTDMAGIEIDLTDLKQQALAVEKALVQLLEKMQEAAHQEGGESFTIPEFAQAEGEEPEPGTDAPKHAGPTTGDGKKHPQLNPATKRRIEQMFESAHEDRSKAFQLKQELDRLKVFEQYEDRFLDLFKKGE